MKRLLLLLLLALAPYVARAEERILDYHSDITVFTDGTMHVTEAIKVRAEGEAIRHGIYRDFPTDYTDSYGNRYRVEFAVTEVERDGRREDYHTERRSNGIRVYIGSAQRTLAPGIYSYRLSYRTDRQLGFFADHDELYWNVTGNGWSFPIERVSATVHLPPGISSAQITPEAYTGYSGAKGRDYRAERYDQGADFQTTRPLAQTEGLTIVVSWPKGFVHEPTGEERIGYLLGDNRELLVALAGLLLTAAYYLLVWARVGRDPEAGIIVPQYAPPAGFAPASTRFIRRMGYDEKTFATAIVGLAVKGLLSIREDEGEYRVERAGGAFKELGPGEKVLLERLFGGRRTTLIFRQSNHATIKAAIDAHKQALKTNYEKVFFLTNSAYLMPGIILTIITLIASVLASPAPDNAAGGAFMMVWLSGWTFGVVFLTRGAIAAWRSARGAGSYAAAIGVTLFALPFLVFELVGIGMLVALTSITMVAILFTAVGLNGLFYHLLKAPTRAGRALLDKIDGFRLYLDVAESDELRLAGAPVKTAQLFENYLPYAMALDLEQRWADRFTALFAALAREQHPYTPGWYYGSRFDSYAMAGFAGSLGSSLSSAIASSSTAPGSSSGSGGGGSSGGGGGGGGGGGW